MAVEDCADVAVDPCVTAVFSRHRCRGTGPYTPLVGQDDEMRCSVCRRLTNARSRLVCCVCREPAHAFSCSTLCHRCNRWYFNPCLEGHVCAGVVHYCRVTRCSLRSMSNWTSRSQVAWRTRRYREETSAWSECDSSDLEYKLSDAHGAVVMSIGDVVEDAGVAGSSAAYHASTPTAAQDDRDSESGSLTTVFHHPPVVAATLWGLPL